MSFNFFLEFHAYVILSLTEIRSQQKICNQRLSLLEYSRSSKINALTSGPSSSSKFENSFVVIEEDDPLYGLPALQMETWVEFNNKCQQDAKFAFEVVTMFIIFHVLVMLLPGIDLSSTGAVVMSSLVLMHVVDIVPDYL